MARKKSNGPLTYNQFKKQNGQQQMTYNQFKERRLSDPSLNTNNIFTKGYNTVNSWISDLGQKYQQEQEAQKQREKEQKNWKTHADGLKGKSTTIKKTRASQLLGDSGAMERSGGSYGVTGTSEGGTTRTTTKKTGNLGGLDRHAGLRNLGKEQKGSVEGLLDYASKYTKGTHADGRTGYSTKIQGETKITDPNFYGYVENLRKNPNNYWRERSQEATYSPQGDQRGQVYAEKMINDTPGARERELERQRRQQEEQKRQFGNYLTGLVREGDTAWQSNTDRLGIAMYNQNRPAEEQITQQDLNAVRNRANNTTGTTGMNYTTGPLQTQEQAFITWMNNLQRKAFEALSYQGLKNYKEDGENRLTVEQQKAMNADVRKNAQSGMYDFLGNPLLMSDHGLKNWQVTTRETAEENETGAAETLKRLETYGQEAETRADVQWGQVWDYIEGLDEQNELAIINGDYKNDQKENAQSTLGKLQRTADSRRHTSVTYANDFFNDRGMRESLEGMPQGEKREYVYNLLMQDKYTERTAKMNPQAKADLDALIDNAIETMESTPTPEELEEQYRTQVITGNAYRSQLKEAEEEENRRTIMSGLQEQASALDLDGSYDPSIAPEVKINYTDNAYTLREPEPQGTEIDKAYYWMNNPHVLNGAENVTEYTNKYMFATDEQVETFNKFYKFDKQNGTNCAGQYLRGGLDYYLTQALYDYQENRNTELAEDPVLGTLFRAASPAFNMVGGAMGTLGTGLALLGNEEAQDRTSNLYRMSKKVQDVRSVQNQNADKWVAENVHPWFEGKVNFLLNTVDSMADNIVAMGVGGKIGNAAFGAGTEGARNTAMKVIQAIMSSEATSSKMIEKLESGMDPTEAAVYAIGQGTIEWITERVSLETLLDPNMKEVLGDPLKRAAYFAKVTGAEGSEEIAADALEMGFDAVMSAINGHESEIIKQYRKLIANDVDPKEAARRVFSDKITQIGLSGLAGAISGFGLGAAHYAGNKITQSNIGANIQKTDTILNNNAVNDLLESAKSIGPDTSSAQQAQSISEKLLKGKKVSKQSLGRLAQTVQVEAQEKLTQTVKDTVRDNVVKMLKENGVVKNTEQLADIITKAKTEGFDSLPKQHQQMLRDNEAAYKVYTDKSLTDKVKSNPDVGSLSEVLASTQNMMEGRTKEGYSPEDVGQHLADETDYRQAEGEQKSGQRVVIVDHKYATFEGIQPVTDENGQETGEYKYAVRFEGDPQIHYVDAGQIKATNFNTAAVIHLRETNPGIYSGKFTNAMLSQIEKGNVTKIGQYASDAYKIRWAAYLQQEMPQTAISEDAAKELYMISQQDAAEEFRKDSERQTKSFRGVGKGRVMFGDVEYGTQEFEDKVSAIKDKDTQQNIRNVAQFAKESGVDLRFMDLDTEEGQKQYGSIDDGTITLNLSGKNFTLDAKTGAAVATGTHSIVVTMGHEMTHWLRSNNEAGYIRLRDFVVNKLQSEGVNLISRAEAKMAANRGAGNNISMTTAIEEIVADACDQVLGNPETMEYIKNNDAGLFKAIKGYVKDLVGRFERWAGRMRNSASYEARAMMKYANELSRIWLGAYNEVLTGKVQEAEQTQAEESTKRLSVSEQNALMQDLQESDGTETHYGDYAKFSVAVTDPQELEFLNGQKTIKTYKSMQLIDGKLYPPMAAVVAGSLEDHSVLGEWEKATEHPELIKIVDGKPKFTLKKGKGKQLDARYNPYMHSSNLMINDQFSGAYGRPELVTVECEVPVSELDSGYHAEYAKDSVGWHSWHTGPVAGKLRSQKGIERKVFLSRWIKPVRIISEAEVAEHYAQLTEGTDIEIPDNVVTPKLLAELKKRGVRIQETGIVKGTNVQKESVAPTEDVQASPITSETIRGTAFNENITDNGENDNRQSGNVRNSMAEAQDENVTRIYDEMGKIREQENALRERTKTLKTESDEWVSRLMAAQENGTWDELLPEYQEWEKGYTENSRKLSELERKRKALQQELDDYIEQRDVAAEQKAIEESGLTETEWRRKQAVKEFGLTTHIREAGYMLPNGKLLNFSGEKGRHLGYRGQDHRAIETIYASRKIERGAAMVKFMTEGNIRVMPESPGLDISSKTEPTKEQYAMIRKMAQLLADEEYFNVDFTDENGQVVDSVEYEGRIRPDKIVHDIQEFYRTGAVPQQSSLSKFYSFAEPNMDVANWMMNQTPGSLMTEGERQLVSAYRGLRTSIDLTQKRIRDYSSEIKTLEEKQQKTSEDRDRLTALKNKLEIQEGKLERLQDELAQVTSTEGYAGMMYNASRFLRQHVEGRTQEQVEAAVDSMANEAARVAEEIKKNEAKLKKMAEDSGVKTVRQALANRGLKETATYLRDHFATSMSQGELEGRLAGIVLKMLDGQDVTTEIEALASDVTNNTVAFDTEETDSALRELRGRTILISQAQQKELKGMNMTLKDIRQRTKGSGVKFEYAKPGEKGTLAGQGASQIEADVPSLRGKLADNETAALETFVQYVEGLLQSRRGNSADYGIDMNDVIGTISSMVNVMLNEDLGGMSKEQLQKRIQQAAGAVGVALNAVQETRKTAEGLILSGKKALGAMSFQRRDVQAAMDYYNQIARQAAEVERQRVRKDVIEKLRSENTQKLIAQEQKYRELMKKDRQAQSIRDENETLRHQIATNIRRFRKFLTEETDQKNIPEETKALARFVSKMVVRHTLSGRRNVLYASPKELADFATRLMKMDANDGGFDADRDLNWLVVQAPNPADNDETAKERVMQDLIDIESGLLEYHNANGQGVVSLEDRRRALEKVQKAVSEIYDVIKARSEIEVNGRKMIVAEVARSALEDMKDSRFKGERRGRGSRTVNAAVSGVGYGNLTPEYFFKMLKNKAISLLHNGMKDAENRSGLEALKAKERIAKIAEECGYSSWDGQEKHQVMTQSGPVTMTTEQIMSLYATWLRESNAMRPEETSHLLHGGFVLQENDQNKGKYRREQRSMRPIRMTEDMLDALQYSLTDKQRQFVHAIVEYMSTDLAALGNEASMKMFGIKKFTEKYYFPIKSWGGVLNKSSDSGITSKSDNRATRQSFSKRVTAGARNAIEIGDFTPTAMKHVVGMITYNTVGPAVENMNKVLNQQLKHGTETEMESGEVVDNTWKQNVRAAFEEAYGKQALQYLETFMLDINGGVGSRYGNTLWDKLLGVFKKSAVGGSLSVAAQQPLSYIRAAMMINPKYLAAAVNPKYWKGSFREMLEHSGVAVIKDMGKFDMNYGRSMIDYITPEAKTTKGKAAWNWIEDKSTSMPSKMDAMTWTRMWTACKLEQAALHPEMDQKSNEFMNLVAGRFNDLMRRTQVYDSVLVKSQNMRSQHPFAKTITSFMAEPTLSLNVLADAWMNIKEQGGKATAAKALATFLLSAAAQAAVKGIFSAGRTPDKKKTEWENFLYRFTYNLMGEANPLGLIPGFSMFIDAVKKGEMTDNSLSVIGKAKDIIESLGKLASGDTKRGWYRNIEDSVGQLVQLATNVPAKNAMRDFRALVNLFSGGRADALTGGGYAQRESSGAVIKYQTIEAMASEDLINLVNTWLGEAGYQTSVGAYEKRIYEARLRGDEQAEKELTEYYRLAKSSAEDPIKRLNANLNSMARKDDNLSAEEKADWLQENATTAGANNYVMDQLKKGELTPEQARKKLKELHPEKTEDDIWWDVDRKLYEKETGKESVSGYYYRLEDAVKNNKTEEIRSAIENLQKHGLANDKIKTQVNTKIKAEYMNADNNTKIRLRDAMQKAYRQLGLTAEDANKTIEKWKKDKDSSKPKKNTVKKSGFDENDPIGQYGKGNINLNARKVVKNEDGSISTERSMSFYDEDTGMEILVPTVVNGKIVSDDEAIEHYYQTGEYLGMFKTPQEADNYAELLHKRQDWYYNRKH